MQEARYSINVKFSLNGYESQITLRDDENCATLIEKYTVVISKLEKMGAVPRASNGNGKSVPKAERPVCKHCDSAEHMELVQFEKDGQSRKAWKCQECDKWHYEKKSK